MPRPRAKPRVFVVVYGTQILRAFRHEDEAWAWGAEFQFTALLESDSADAAARRLRLTEDDLAWYQRALALRRYAEIGAKLRGAPYFERCELGVVTLDLD
jgi:hypothetical protein